MFKKKPCYFFLGLLDFSIHPSGKIQFVSVSYLGDLFIWSKLTHDLPTAFAPEFTEIDENIEYEEREDEFDLVKN